MRLSAVLKDLLNKDAEVKKRVKDGRGTSMMEASACLLQGNLDIELGVEQLLRAHAKLQFTPSCTCGPHTYPARSSKTHQFVEGSTCHQHGFLDPTTMY